MSDQSQGFGGDIQGTGNQDSTMSDLGSDFLKGIPDAERPIVEKYIKDWDAGVTKQFQGIHGQYAGYKELGDVETLQQAVAIAKLLDDDPEQVFNALSEALGKNVQPPAGNGNQNQLGSQQQSQPQNLQVPSDFAAHLNPLQEQFASQQKMLEQLAQIVIQTNQSARDVEEDKQLDAVLNGLREKHKVNFDENAILLQMHRGIDPDQAVENWKASVTEAAKALGLSTYSGPTPPPGLTGGSVPSSDTSVNDMDRKEVQSLVANIFAAVQQDQH